MLREKFINNGENIFPVILKLVINYTLNPNTSFLYKIKLLKVRLKSTWLTILNSSFYTVIFSVYYTHTYKILFQNVLNLQIELEKKWHFAIWNIYLTGSGISP